MHVVDAEQSNPAQWTALDLVMPEGLLRRDLDRPFKLVNRVYAEAFPDSPSPRELSIAIIERTGSLAIADIGCGTGRTLHEGVRAIMDHTGCSRDAIRSLGTSLYDYSGMSLSQAVRDAYANGEHEYQVTGAERLRLPAGAFDIVIAHESLPYSERPGACVAEIYRITRPGGLLFFSGYIIPLQQTTMPLERPIAGWKRSGVTVQARRMAQERGANPGSVLFRVEKPPKNIGR